MTTRNTVRELPPADDPGQLERLSHGEMGAGSRRVHYAVLIHLDGGAELVLAKTESLHHALLVAGSLLRSEVERPHRVSIEAIPVL
jgi:hypothetical protein